MFDPARLPGKLKAGRDFRNYSQQGIAGALGVHVSTYNKWELGHREPNAVDLAKIANELRLSIEFFFTDMQAKDADLDHADERNELARLRDEISSMRSFVTGARSEDPTLLAVEHNPILRRFVQRMRNVDETKLQRALDKAEGYLDGIEEESERGKNAERSIS